MARTKLTPVQLTLTYSTSEVVTGETWIDGKPVYRQTFSNTVAASASEQVINISLTSSVTRIIKVEGGSTAGNDFYPVEYMNPAATTLQNMQLKITFVSGTGWQLRGNTGTAGTLIVTIYYTR